jgi:hypothetical protein
MEQVGCLNFNTGLDNLLEGICRGSVEVQLNFQAGQCWTESPQNNSSIQVSKYDDLANRCGDKSFAIPCAKSVYINASSLTLAISI